MAVVIRNSSPHWNATLYEQTATRAWEGPEPTELPAGFIAHASMPRTGGGWEVLEIWESEDLYQQFLEARILPAAEQIGAPPFDSEVIEAHTVLTR